MEIVEGMEFESLAFAVSEWHQDLSCDLLREMTSCFQLENGTEETRRLPSSYIRRQNADINASLLFIALVISFSQTPSFSKLVIHELDIVTFIAENFSAILNPDSDFGLSLLPAKLVLCALLEKLDPTVDSLDAPSIAQLQVLLSTNALSSISLVSESENNIRASILSRVRLGVNIPSSKIDEKALHLQELQEHKAKLDSQIKVLLLGSRDSGKSTFLKQMRLLHDLPFSAQEIEAYRQLIFSNLIFGMKYILDAMVDMDLKVAEDNISYVNLIENATDIRDEQAFPRASLTPLTALWADPGIQCAYERGNEFASPENLDYYFSEIDRLFQPNYQPTEQDIMHARARTIGITKTVFTLKDRREMIVLDVSGAPGRERHKWIWCSQDVTCIFFLVSLNGHDQCLIENKNANQMQDAMIIWESICRSRWFAEMPLILVFTKYDLFEKKIPNSDIKSFFPDYDGEPSNVKAGQEYFKKCFGRLAQKADQTKQREIYIHTTTMTDNASFRVVMAAVEALCFNQI
ncbi:G-alpha-domain-containing protein [Gymnopus androsaceus JB14]|uniref:G-alpha-domain-containing protein n=1 Tax=Gymnopus androsaceus JB14 TaxID=1447944 RepID=A0A6A4GS35_9AGAR|nr:G-alpha-domain-containing protein [Gymnopus androsaceus JB14]